MPVDTGMTTRRRANDGKDSSPRAASTARGVAGRSTPTNTFTLTTPTIARGTSAASHVRCNAGAANRRRTTASPRVRARSGDSSREGWYNPSGTGPCSRQWGEDYYWVGRGKPSPRTALGERSHG